MQPGNQLQIVILAHKDTRHNLSVSLIYLFFSKLQLYTITLGYRNRSVLAPCIFGSPLPGTVTVRSCSGTLYIWFHISLILSLDLLRPVSTGRYTVFCDPSQRGTILYLLLKWLLWPFDTQ